MTVTTSPLDGLLEQWADEAYDDAFDDLESSVDELLEHIDTTTDEGAELAALADQARKALNGLVNANQQRNHYRQENR